MSPTGATVNAEADLAEAIVARVLATPGVAALHGGMFGEVAIYLPARRIVGVQMDATHVAVHIVMTWGADVRRVAADVQTGVAQLTPERSVSVTVEDIATEFEPEDHDG